MRVLVCAASKYGSTAEIAHVIGEELRAQGVDAEVYVPDGAAHPGEFDAVVAGSAVYAGHWLDEAKDFVHRNRETLASRPVWLFSSGPLGEPPKPEEDPVDAAPLIEATGAREHRVFAGKLDRHRLSFWERALVRALRAPEGDFRDWDEIRSWARSIAESLEHEAAATRPAGGDGA